MSAESDGYLSEDERRFVWENVGPEILLLTGPKYGLRQLRGEVLVKVVAFLEEDEAHLDQGIIDLVKRFGPEVFRAPPLAGCIERPVLEKAVEQKLRLRIRELAWNRVTTAFVEARDDRSAEQRSAAQFLKEFGNALAGDRRGSRERAPKVELRARYYLHLFRLTRAAKELKASNARAVRGHLLRKVARSCGLSESDLREFVNLDGNGKPERLRLTPEEGSRILTARVFGVTQQTVSNSLVSRSRSRKSRSRK